MSFFPHISEEARKVPAPCMFVYTIFCLIWLCFQAAQIRLTHFILIHSVGLVKGRPTFPNTLPASQHRAEVLTSSLRFSWHHDHHLLLLIREPYFLLFKSLPASVCLLSVLFMFVLYIDLPHPHHFWQPREKGSEHLWSPWSKPARLCSPARQGPQGPGALEWRHQWANGAAHPLPQLREVERAWWAWGTEYIWMRSFLPRAPRSRSHWCCFDIRVWKNKRGRAWADWRGLGYSNAPHHEFDPTRVLTSRDMIQQNLVVIMEQKWMGVKKTYIFFFFIVIGC